MQKTFYLLCMTALVTGCSITQTVVPVGDVTTNEVCIIENPAVREGFLPEMRNALEQKGFSVAMLDESARTSDCPTVVTYTARWSWDLTIYMSYAEISVYQSGQPTGKALYDATSGGGRLDKFIDAEPKIRELVDELFPGDSSQLVINGGVSPDEVAMMEQVSPDETVNASGKSSESGSAADAYDELLKLDDLRERGILTDEEFEAEKARILGKD